MHTYSDIFSDKHRCLFVTAHPDDLVVSFGALIHQLRLENKEVFVVLVTNGARGSRENVISENELAEQRLQEESNCLEKLGVSQDNFVCLEYKDGAVESDLKLIGQIAKYIRKFKVDLVATHEPCVLYRQTYAKTGYFVQHRDHRKIGEAVIDAVYPFSRDRSFFPEHSLEGIEPHQVYDILLTDELECNFKFDYTEHVEHKREAMRCHHSQFDEETIEAILSAFKEGDRFLEKFQYLKLAW